MSAPQYHFIDTGEVKLRAVVEGEGPLVVLVHGWPESWYSFRHQLAALKAAGFRVAALDMRGYGGSDKPQAIEAYSMRRLCGDVAALIEALGGAPAVVVGNDWGAIVAWTTAIIHRRHVRAVVGMSVPFVGRSPRPLSHLYRKLFTERGRFFYQLYFQEPGVAERELDADISLTLRKTYHSLSADMPWEQVVALFKKPSDAKFLDGMVDPTSLPAWLTDADLEYVAAQYRDGGFRGSLNAYRNLDRDWEELPDLATEKITQPALFLAGEKDPVLTLTGGINLFDVLDPFYLDLRKKVLIPGAGHFAQQERPQEVNRELLEFLAGC